LGMSPDESNVWLISSPMRSRSFGNSSGCSM
jgi:hypothetical protein